MNTTLPKRHTLAALAAAGLGGALPPIAKAQGRGMPEEHIMQYPDFFTQAPVITMRDPLAEFLGATANGIMQYTYLDAVKMAGHSCAVVASSYLLARRGLKRLYGDDTPVRGDIQIAIRNGGTEGTTGVTGAVLTLITGAAGDTGFHGMGKSRRFSRQDLLMYRQEVDDFLTLRRRDTGKTVGLSLDIEAVPFRPEMQDLLPQAIAGTLPEQERGRFADLWQDRVRRILLEHAEDPALIQVRDI
ncbi:hypothetical protein [Paracandidimonas soli]|uniref:Formylmethanofuran dehydrogenase subunit E n=1 Tax=Paracandidimonas soli TaxID=1917182 RepID=A0A4R3V527_9BURK|nr:hypothetical protein [Paracandidimonas soli]TCU98387.1 formylmethanofuran dehydrogenase subunit E [Paracandidimonas soli]